MRLQFLTPIDVQGVVIQAQVMGKELKPSVQTRKSPIPDQLNIHLLSDQNRAHNAYLNSENKCTDLSAKVAEVWSK